MIKYLFSNNFVNTRGYPWISADMKKIDGYPHNGYSTDIDTGQIFIQQIGVRGSYYPYPTRPVNISSLNYLKHKNWYLF